MMTINKIKNGQFITCSTTEQAFELSGDHKGIQVVACVVQSGTVQGGVADRTADPILDNTYTTQTTSDPLNKFFLTVATGNGTLRFRTASAGVVGVSW